MMSTMNNAASSVRDNVYLATSETAAWLGIAERTLANWRWRGEGPRFVKVGRLVRYRIRDLEAWIDDATRANTSKGGDHE